MYGHGNYRNSGIRIIRNYAEALDRYDTVEPIKGTGRNGGLKPLGHRNRTHFQLLKGTDNEIKCRLYDTDVVTFYPDDTIKITDATYTTQTTGNFIEDVLGIGAAVRDHDIVISMHGKSYRLGDGVVMKRDEQGILRVLKVDKAYVHTINRKAMTKLRNNVKDFMQYLNGSIKVRDNGRFNEEEKEELLDHLGMNDYSFGLAAVPTWRTETDELRKRLGMFFDMVKSGDMENWYRASCWMAFSQYTWVKSISLTPKQAKVTMDNFILAVYPEALTKIEVPEGMVKRDRYRHVALMSGA
jgi:hypothetical protein